MTALENRRRRKERRKSTGVVCRKLLSKVQPRGGTQHVLEHRIQLGPADGTFLRLDTVTAALIKMEVSVLLENSNNRKEPCTVLSMANALLGSREVKDLYAKQEGSSGTHRRFFRDRFREVHRRYQYTLALQRMEKRSGSSAKTIETWEEALQELSCFFSFPEEATEVETRKKDQAMQEFTKRLNTITLQEKTAAAGLRPSQRSWLEVDKSSFAPKIIGDIVEGLDKTDQTLAKRLEEEYKKRDERQKKKEIELMEKKLLEKEAQERAASLLRPLGDDERAVLEETVYDDAHPEDEIIARVGTDSIMRKSMRTLRPGCWLNDEAIHYFYIMLAKRDEELCNANPERKRSHFFKSFFMTKLLNEGHSTEHGKYEYRNVKRWSKKVPGKNIFKLDKIFFPINQGNAHWVCAVVFMQKKRIQFYDSMGGDGMEYLESLKRYLEDEHKDKLGEPLPDADDWELVRCTRDTPQQRNGFDCGVFTCMFADFLSKDCPLLFDQSHITQCRERIAVSIMNGAAIL